MGEKTKKKGSISYAKWGYIFIAPFFIIFAVFQLIPLISTIYYSFFEYYRSGLKVIGPNFAGLKNYITLFSTDLPKYFSNTLILWIIGFIPQIAISLVVEKGGSGSTLASIAADILRGRSGTGEERVLDLTEDSVRLLVLLDRAGAFGS